MITAPDLLLNRSKQMGVVEKNPEEREKREESEPGDRRHTTRCLAALAILGLSVLSDLLSATFHATFGVRVGFNLLFTSRFVVWGSFFSRAAASSSREARCLFRRQV